MTLLDPQLWLSLITLTILEIVLGIDNLVFIAIVSNNLPEEKQKMARRLGLFFACLMRLVLLAGITWIIGMTKPLFTMANQTVSLRDIVLIAGGLFLLVKGTIEIHATIEGVKSKSIKAGSSSMFSVITQIMIFDLVFSLDSVLTAIGLSQQYFVMATAIILAVAAMIFASEPLSRFINKHITIKMLALSFLLLIGVMLIADGFQVHIPRAYIYFAIAFSIFVEFLNSLVRRKKE